MSKKWYAILGGIAVVVVILLLLPIKQKSNNIAEQPSVPPPQQPFQASEEKDKKLKMMQNNIDTSLSIVMSELQSDLKPLLEEKQSKPAITKIDALQKDHPYYVYIRWQNNKSKVQRGNIPSSDDGLIKSYMKKADQLHVNGDSYQSESFYGSDHAKYRVFSFVSNDTKIVSVIKDSIGTLVEEDQRSNLRIIPYPAEGKYKVESVLPNSTIDTTVRDGEDNGNASHYYENEVVVQFNHQLAKHELDHMKKDIGSIKVLKMNDTYIFKSNSKTTEQLIAYFKEQWDIKFIEPHYLYLTNEETSFEIIPNDALFEKYQWNIRDIQALKGWNLSKGSEDVIIAVLDTGVQLDHPDLVDKLITGYNVEDSTSNANDDFGHGTHVAGIIGATVNNEEGVAGVSWYNKLMPVKVLNSSGSGSTYSVAQGIIWATDNGAKVINMSLGNYASADFLHEAIKYAYERDVVLIAASGNDNTARPGYPAAYPEVFAVGATTNTHERAAFSNYGDYIDVVAPGDAIASTYIGGQYAALSGTSMASPHVAALAGLIRSINPSLTNVQVMEIMRQSASDLGDSGKDNFFGYGEIDIERALTTAISYTETLQQYPQSVNQKLKRMLTK